MVAQRRNILSSKYTPDEMNKLLIPQAQWTPFPKMNDREGWAKADQNMLKHYISEAEKYLTYGKNKVSPQIINRCVQQ
jgi:hypothetical protein